MRHISVGFPSGQVKMTLWEDTEDEESFAVRGIKSGKPYVMAYGIKYELTKEEAKFINSVTGLKNRSRKNEAS